MLNILLIIVAVPVVAVLALAAFSFVAGLVTPLSTSAGADDDQPLPSEAHPVIQHEPSVSEGRELATGVLANILGFGFFLLILVGLTLLCRSWGQ